MTKESSNIDQRNVDNICCTFYQKRAYAKNIYRKKLSSKCFALFIWLTFNFI